GNSKMSRNIVAEALWRVTTWGIGSRIDKITGAVAGAVAGGAKNAGRSAGGSARSKADAN
ncbi:dolichol-phosphate mannosyltransferase, partial [Kitasatospora sp. NPDC007106]